MVPIAAVAPGLPRSLAAIAEQRGVASSGLHQGGFDAMLTRDVFFSLPDAARTAAEGRAERSRPREPLDASRVF